jgi:hypothetical protein
VEWEGGNGIAHHKHVSLEEGCGVIYWVMQSGSEAIMRIDYLAQVTFDVM